MATQPTCACTPMYTVRRTRLSRENREDVRRHFSHTCHAAASESAARFLAILALCRASFSLLRLSGLALQGTLPAQMGTLTSLRSLNLAGNNFTGALPDLGKLVGLAQLQLADNRFSGPLFKVRKTPNWPRNWANFSLL